MNFFGKKNHLIIVIAVLVLSLGFFLLGRGPADNKTALNVAPLVLVFAYLVIIPIGILMSGEKDSKK